MLHEAIRNDDFQRLGLGLGSQHCCDIVLSSYNTVPTLERCVALRLVVAIRPVYHHLKTKTMTTRTRFSEY